MMAIQDGGGGGLADMTVLAGILGGAGLYGRHPVADPAPPDSGVNEMTVPARLGGRPPLIERTDGCGPLGGHPCEVPGELK